MSSVIKHHVRTFMLSVAAAALLSSSVQADCTYELFNISSVKGTSIGDFVDQLSDECGMSVIITDVEAEKILSKQMNKTFLKNLTINEVLDLIIKENNLQYTLHNNVLKISYLTTKTYNIDYIISQRIGTGSANITLSSNTSTSASGNSSSGSSTGTTGSGSGGGASSESGIKITSSDEVQFWETLDKELESVLNRPEDGYKAIIPMINKSAGLVTVTGTGTQLKRLDTYLDDLQKKMQTQVLIDVKMYSVVFSDASSTGIDWGQLYALQNIGLGFNAYNTKNITEFTGTAKDNIIGNIETVTYGQTPSIINRLLSRPEPNFSIKQKIRLRLRHRQRLHPKMKSLVLFFREFFSILRLKSPKMEVSPYELIRRYRKQPAPLMLIMQVEQCRRT